MNITITPEVRSMLNRIAKDRNVHYSDVAGQLLEPAIRLAFKQIIDRKIPPASNKLKLAIKTRDKNICQYCGGRANGIDHIIPRGAIGSTNTESNLVAACNHCNAIAHATVFATFDDKKRYIMEEYERRERALKYQSGLNAN